MKYIIIIGDGMADWPISSLDGRTPLMVAKTPNMDFLAEHGQCGQLITISAGMPTGSAVANLSILGYEPEKHFHGRGVLEAANMGIELDDDDVAFRCNIICIEEDRIKNHSAGHISTNECSVLIEELNKKLGTDTIEFHCGVSYRHLLVLKNGSDKIICTPPHDVPGTKIEKVFPKPKDEDDHEAGESAKLLKNLIVSSHDILSDHEINKKRIAEGKDPGNSIWPWSAGKKPEFEKFEDKYGLKAAVISAVDLINGIGIYAGMEVIKVEGATGLYDTNYEGKAEACLEGLKRNDFLYLHVEASDEAGHEGDLELKIKTIEYLDNRLIGRILKQKDNVDENINIAVLPDHLTPIVKRTHVRDPVPFLTYKENEERDDVNKFDEESVKEGGFGLLKGDEFIRTFIDR